MQWFYVEHNEQAGPVQDADFARLQAEGLIRDHTLVYCQGMADWMSLADARSQGFWSPPPSAAASPADAVPAASNPLAAAGLKPKMAESGGVVDCPACGARVWENERIPMGDHFVCVHCRDVTLQKIREGVDPRGVLQIVRCGLACRLMTVPHLYCWESLVPLYTKRGWRTVETYPFDPAQAPEGWTGGEQACHVMRWPDAGKYARTSEAYRYGLGLIK